jgi:glycerol-3-phosphate dehydrogenase (NAD(P)+)
MNIVKVAVLGDGGWGTTLAILLSRKGYSVNVWGAFKDYVAYLDKKRINPKFLPGFKIPKAIKFTHNLPSALADSQLAVLAVPSQYLRKVLRQVKKIPHYKDKIYLNVSKGIEVSSLKVISEVIKEELGNVDLGILSGPTIAHEVAQGIPTAAVIASDNKALSGLLQDVFSTEQFRVYTNPDVIGVELGGSLKNVIAIACGIADGLGLGTNTKAALLSRGLAEISRLGVAMGAKASTFSGISGLGDLVTTCISPYSRNRFIGEQIAKGQSLKQVTHHMQMIAEGVPTTKSVYALGLKYKVELPITKEVYNVLYKDKSPFSAVRNLMTRKKKEE